jgi:tetratricopeptide (TPR) repeat protein
MIRFATVLGLVSALAGPVLGQQVRESLFLQLPEPSQHATVSQRIGLTDIAVDYHRPLAGNRKIWGDVVKFAQVWRAGANDNTVFEISDAVTVEGKPLPAGKYGLHMIPNEDEWTVIFSKNHTSWGSFTYDPAEDALRVTVKPRAAEMQDALLYSFENLHPDSAELTLRWERRAIPILLKVDVNASAVSSLRNQLRHLNQYHWASWDDAAAWLTDMRLEPETALKWAEQSVAIEPRFANLQTKARGLEALGRTPEAAATMKLAMEKASALETYNYARSLQIQNKSQEDAIAIFREMPKRFPDSWVSRLAQARVHSSRKEFPAAVSEARAALAGAPDLQKTAVQRLIDRLEAGNDINR